MLPKMDIKVKLDDQHQPPINTSSYSSSSKSRSDKKKKRVLEVLEPTFSAMQQIISNLSSEKRRHSKPQQNLMEAI